MKMHILTTLLFLAGAWVLPRSAMAADGEPAGALPGTAYLFSYFISRKGVEGPSVLKMGNEYVVYFDGFAGGGYGAMKTKDFIKWDEQSTKLVVPPGTKHGSALAVPGKIIGNLLARDKKP